MHLSYDIVVIGGGIVGLATAMALTERRPLKLVVLEAEPRLAAHQTGRNSGVIHSGLYYRPGSLKARNCVAGRDALYEFCARHAIPHDRCGKIVVATSPADLPWLDELARRGQVNGLKGLERLDAGRIREFEPHAAGLAALWVPETGIVDFASVTEAYARIVRDAGGEVRTSSRVLAARRESDRIVLETAGGDVHGRHLINCAGLQSDRIARLCGVDPGLQIIPFRGEYFELLPERRALARNLIYPVPDPKFPFLGVHFTRMIDGRIEAGPNAVLALRREGYSRLSFSFGDLGEMLAYPGFWRMARRYGATGLAELHRSIFKSAFLHDARRLIPELRDGDLRRTRAGVRAQAVTPDGKLVDDFVIRETPRMIHVLNAPSPAATSSIEIGRAIAELALKNFELGG